MTTYTQNILLSEPTPFDPAVRGTWGSILNVDFVLIDSAIAGILSLDVSGNSNITLTSTQGASDQARNQHFVFTGTLSGAISVFWPASRNRFFSVNNATSGAFALTIAVTGTPGTVVVAPQGQTIFLKSDGTNISERFNCFASGLTVTGGASIDNVTLLTSLVFTRPTVGGTGNAILLTYSPAPGSYVSGAKYSFVPTAANSGPATVNINGLGIKSIYTIANGTPTALVGNELAIGGIAEIEYDGTQFQILNPAYDEGSWTPALAGASVAGTQTYSSRVGRYIRIGDLVTVFGTIVMTAKDAATAGTATITGLPFTASTVASLEPGGAAVQDWENIFLIANYTCLGIAVASGAATATLQQSGSGQPGLPLNTTGIIATSALFFTFQYRIN